MPPVDDCRRLVRRCAEGGPRLRSPGRCKPPASRAGVRDAEGSEARPLVLVNRRQRRLVNIRYWADQSIEAIEFRSVALKAEARVIASISTSTSSLPGG